MAIEIINEVLVTSIDFKTVEVATNTEQFIART